MIKYLVSAAAAAVLSISAFAAAPAAAQGFGVSVGVNDGYRGDRHHYGHNRHYRHHGYGPGVRVYSGRSAYRDDCYTKRTVKWRNGRKIVRETRICD